MNTALWLLGLVLLIGVVVWGIQKMPFINQDFKKLAYVIIAVGTMIYVLNLFGIMPSLPGKSN